MRSTGGSRDSDSRFVAFLSVLQWGQCLSEAQMSRCEIRDEGGNVVPCVGFVHHLLLHERVYAMLQRDFRRAAAGGYRQCEIHERVIRGRRLAQIMTIRCQHRIDR